MGDFTRIYQNPNNGTALYGPKVPGNTLWGGFYIEGVPTAPDTLVFSVSINDPLYRNDAKAGKNGGIYLIAKQPPSDPALLAAAVQQWLKNLATAAGGETYRYVLWIENPDLNPVTGQALPFSFDTTRAGSFIPGSASVDFRQFSIHFNSNTEIGLASTQSGILFTNRNDPSAIRFQEDHTQLFGEILNITIDYDLQNPYALSLQFPYDLSIQGSSLTDWERFQVGLHYSYMDQGIVHTQTYPVLGKTVNPKDSQVAMEVRLDPLRPLDAERSAFLFVDMPAQGQGMILFSGFRTIFGEALDIETRPRISTLVFSPVKRYDKNGVAGDGYYLSPAQVFRLRLQGATPTYTDPGQLPLLACGLSGTEYISFQPLSTNYSGDLFMFTPGQPAFAPGFPLTMQAVSAPIPKRLDNTYTTSWMAVQPQTGSVTPDRFYYSQPEMAPLYWRVQGNSGDLLNHYPAPSALLPTVPGFPIGAYAGISAGTGTGAMPADQLAPFEFEVLNRARHDAIAAGQQGSPPALLPPGLPLQNGNIATTTPQGYRVEIKPDATWAAFVIAKNASLEFTPTGPVPKTFTLQFLNLDKQLKLAMQTNQEFLVITDPKLLGTMGASGSIPDTGQPIFNNVMALEGWPFILNVGSGELGNYQNVLLFKFGKGTVAELVLSPQRWSQAATFNDTTDDGLRILSDWMDRYISYARKRFDAGDVQFKKFVEVVDDPDWNGMMALNVDLALQQLPAPLKGLLAGMEQSAIRGHHLAVELNQVDGQVTMAADSSMFALIDYIDEVYRKQVAKGGAGKPVPYYTGNTDYNFRVLQLLVQFEKSRLTDFTCLSQLTLLKLFGEQTDPNATGADLVNTNTILINGDYNVENGQDAFSFGNADVRTVFPLDSHILQAVRIDRVQFSTIGDPAPGGPVYDANTVLARFQFWGALDFRQFQGLDVLSFGTAPGTATVAGQEGLVFSNLGLDLQFDFKTPSVVTWHFDATQLRFDLKTSLARQDSLYAQFPIQFNSLLQMPYENPDQSGFQLVTTSLSTLPLGQEWYALNYRLNMGGPGALANANYSTDFLVAWSPGGSKSASPALALYLMLPTAGGNVGMFELEGVIKVKVSDLSMVRSTDSPPVWMLKLNGIVLELLVAKLPRNAVVDFYLFGDPKAGGKGNSLGWYLGYQKNKMLTI